MYPSRIWDRILPEKTSGTKIESTKLYDPSIEHASDMSMRQFCAISVCQLSTLIPPGTKHRGTQNSLPLYVANSGNLCLTGDLYRVAFKIEVIEKSGEVTSPHPARFGLARLRARPSARRRWRLPSTCWGAAAAPYGPRSCEGVRPHKRSGANLKRRASVRCVSANPNGVRVRGAKLPELFSFFWRPLERKLVLKSFCILPTS